MRIIILSFKHPSDFKTFSICFSPDTLFRMRVHKRFFIKTNYYASFPAPKIHDFLFSFILWSIKDLFFSYSFFNSMYKKIFKFFQKRNGFFSKGFFTQNLVQVGINYFFRFSPIDEFIRHPSLSDFPNDLFCLIECIRNQIFLIFKIVLSSFCLNHLKTSIKYCYTSFLIDSAPIYQHFKVIFRFIETFPPEQILSLFFDHSYK